MLSSRNFGDGWLPLVGGLGWVGSARVQECSGEIV